ncbi:hypothetical protein P9869_24655 [Streptomyces ossamyceticus]|nr:hypothetical protein [Streptomyces ossamyceticus]
MPAAAICDARRDDGDEAVESRIPGLLAGVGERAGGLLLELSDGLLFLDLLRITGHRNQAEAG